MKSPMKIIRQPLQSRHVMTLIQRLRLKKTDQSAFRYTATRMNFSEGGSLYMCVYVNMCHSIYVYRSVSLLGEKSVLNMEGTYALRLIFTFG